MNRKMCLVSLIHCSIAYADSSPINTNGFKLVNYSTIPLVSQLPLVVGAGGVAIAGGVVGVAVGAGGVATKCRVKMVSSCYMDPSIASILGSVSP